VSDKYHTHTQTHTHANTHTHTHIQDKDRSYDAGRWEVSNKYHLQRNICSPVLFT